MFDFIGWPYRAISVKRKALSGIKEKDIAALFLLQTLYPCGLNSNPNPSELVELIELPLNARQFLWQKRRLLFEMKVQNLPFLYCQLFEMPKQISRKPISRCRHPTPLLNVAHFVAFVVTSSLFAITWHNWGSISADFMYGSRAILFWKHNLRNFKTFGANNNRWRDPIVCLFLGAHNNHTEKLQVEKRGKFESRSLENHSFVWVLEARLLEGFQNYIFNFSLLLMFLLHIVTYYKKNNFSVVLALML